MGGGPVPAASAADEGPPSIGAWLKAGLSQVGAGTALGRPTADPPDPAVGPRRRRGLQALPCSPRPIVDNRGPVRIQDNFLVRFWRRELGDIQKVFRWLNESAVFRLDPLPDDPAVRHGGEEPPPGAFGATFVVLLNLGRLAAGAVNLALVPLRDGLNSRKLKKPVRRVAEPILTIAAGVPGVHLHPLALAAAGPAEGSLADRVRAGASGLEKEIEGEVDCVVKKARKIDVEKLGDAGPEETQGDSVEHVKGAGIPERIRR